MWFDELPEYDPEASEDVYAVFTGVVNNVENIVIHISSNKVVRVLNVSGYTIWQFDYAASSLIARTSPGQNWGSQVAEQLGPGYTSGAFMSVENVDYDMISCKIAP